MSNRFHNKWHRHNHHTAKSTTEPDAGYDPIGSQTDPFVGNFYLSGALSARDDTFGLGSNAPLNININTPVISSSSYVSLHFTLDISDTSTFSALNLTANSTTDLTNWEYWNGTTYQPLLSVGLISSYQSLDYGNVAYTWHTASRGINYYVRYRSWNGAAYSTYQTRKVSV